jgi:hypothetical protein
MEQETLPYLARQALEITTTEAGQLVHVTRRTWEMWESGKGKMPLAKRDLFIAKLQGMSENDRELLVVVADDGQTPVFVVSSQRFCSIVQADDGTYVISSLAVHRHNGRPYVHRQRFQSKHNSHVLKKAMAWKSVLDQ